MKKKRRKDGLDKALHVHAVLSELTALRRELRETLRAYSARLEIALAETVNELTAIREGKKVSRKCTDEIRDFAVSLRKRKFKPQNGRRKDLHKIEKLIGDLHAAIYPNTSDQASS